MIEGLGSMSPLYQVKLTHWGRDNMDAISQTTFSSALSWMKMFEFRLKFHWSLFLRVQLTGDKPLYELMMVVLPTHICVTRPQWVKPDHETSGREDYSDITKTHLNLLLNWLCVNSISGLQQGKRHSNQWPINKFSLLYWRHANNQHWKSYSWI